MERAVLDGVIHGRKEDMILYDCESKCQNVVIARSEATWQSHNFSAEGGSTLTAPSA